MNKSCSTSLAAFDVVSVLDLGHSNRYAVIFHFCFNLHFPADMILSIFLYIYFCQLYILFDEVSVQVFDPYFFVWWFSCCWVVRVLCIFWITVLYQICLFANIFSQSVPYLFILLTMSFAEQIILNLMKSKVSVLSMTDHEFGVTC